MLKTMPLIYNHAKDFKEGQAKVKLNGKWIIIDTTEEEIKEEIYKNPIQ
jgi:hypothetical protein